MDLSVFLDIFGILLVGFVFCLLPSLVIGGLIYSTVVKFGQRTAHEKLGKALGFNPLNRADNLQLVWYGGRAQGRDVAINTFTSTHRYYALERTRRGFNTELRIAMALNVKEPLGVHAYRNKKNNSPQTFEEAFAVEQGTLSSAAREAMLAFSFLGHKTGIKRDLRVAFIPGMRDLRLLDRSVAPKGLLGDEILTGAKTILTHDHPFTDVSPAELKTILEEMSAVAQAIEEDRVPPLLAGKSAPPPEGKGKYVYWAFMGFIVLGLPTCLCLCGMVYSFLDAYR
jgi:hypothetical protein